MTNHRFSILGLAVPAISFLMVAPVAIAQDPVIPSEPARPQRVELDTVVVSASGYEQSINEAPASISVLTSKDLQERRVSSLAEALSDVEGVDIGGSQGKTGGLSISMRGLPPEYTLILVDGRRQNVAGNVTPNGFGGTETHFLPAVIERIEVIRGPMSTLYGSDAMGGVINIITPRVNREWGGSITAGGTFQGDSDFGNIYNGGVYLSGPLIDEKLGLTLRGSHQHREASDLQYLEDGEPVDVSKRGPSPVKSDISTVGARLTYVPHPDHELWLDTDYSWQTYDNSQGQLGTLGVRGYRDEQKFNRQQHTLAHTWHYNLGQIDTSLMRNTTETIGRVIPAGTPGKEEGSDRTLENENWVLDTKATFGFDAHNVIVGGQYADAEMIDGVATAPFEHIQWALFAEDEWRLLSNLALTVGGRYDHHDQFGSHTSPRGYLVWSVTPHWSIKGGVSQGFKAPRLDQLADGIIGFSGQGTIPLIGSPTLTPETSTSGEIGIVYDNQEWFRSSLTVFRNEFDDKIARGPGVPNATWAGWNGAPPQDAVDYGNWPLLEEFSQYINVDEAVTKGAEFAARFLFGENWSLTSNYTFTESEQKSGAEQGQPLYATPKHMVNSRLRWEATEKLSFWLSGEYRSERYRRAGPEKDAFGNYRSYALFHLGGSYQVTEHLTINATLYNLLNRDFVDYRPYTETDGSTDYENRYRINEEPRRLWMSATLTF